MCAALGLTEGRIEGRMLHPEVSGRGQSLRFPGEPLPGQASRFTRPAMPSEDAEGPARVTGTAPARAPGLSALAARGKAWDAAGAGALLPRPVGGSHVPGASESRGDLHLRVTFSATTPTRNQPCSHCGPRPPLPAGGGGGPGRCAHSASCQRWRCQPVPAGRAAPRCSRLGFRREPSRASGRCAGARSGRPPSAGAPADGSHNRSTASGRGPPSEPRPGPPAGLRPAHAHAHAVCPSNCSLSPRRTCLRCEESQTASLSVGTHGCP